MSHDRFLGERPGRGRCDGGGFRPRRTDPGIVAVHASAGRRWILLSPSGAREPEKSDSRPRERQGASLVRPLPVIVPRESYGEWLSPETPEARLVCLLRPYPADEM